MAIYPLAFIPRKERSNGRDLLWYSNTLLRMHICEELDLLVGLTAPEQIGVDRAGSDCVDGDTLCSKVLGKHANQLVYCALSGRLDEVVGWRGGVLGDRCGEEDNPRTYRLSRCR